MKGTVRLLYSEEVMVSWEKMRNYWIYLAFESSDETGGNVKTYLNKFITNNPGFSFTIAQMYDELFHVFITTKQCSDIKRKIEKKFKIELDVRTQELLSGGAKKEISFRNAYEFRQFRENTLVELNKPIITGKHKEARDHFGKVKNAFSIQEPKEFLAFDTEVYEHDHSKALEIGYVVVRFSPARPQTEGSLPKAEVISREHLIIEEHLHFKNKDNVPDNRDGFVFGVSKTMSMADAVER